MWAGRISIYLNIICDQFPVSGIFQADGNLDYKRLLNGSYLFNFRAIFSLANKRIPPCSENSTDRKSAFRPTKHAASRHGAPSLTSHPKENEVDWFVRPPICHPSGVWLYATELNFR